MPRPKTYDSSADRARAWRERRGGELRAQLISRLQNAEPATIERLIGSIPMPALMRLNRALDWAEDPEAAAGHTHEHTHGPGPRGQHRHHGPFGRRARCRRAEGEMHHGRETDE